PALVMQALRASADVFRAGSDSIGDEEVERAHTLTRTRLLRGLKTVDGHANMLADWQGVGDWQIARAYYARKHAAATPALRAAATCYLVTERASLVVYSPRDADLSESTDAMATALFDGAPAVRPARTAATT